MDAAAEAVYANFPDLTIIPVMSAYGTDCTHFRAAGIACYGAAGLYTRPADDFTHGLNERILINVIPSALVQRDVLIRTIIC